MPTTTTLTTPRGPLGLTLVPPEAPEGKPIPAVLLCIDALGPRDALTAMAQRIANASRVMVLIPDLFFTSGDIFDLLPPGSPRTTSALWEKFYTTELRTVWGRDFYAKAVDLELLKIVGAACLDFLDTREDIVRGTVGLTGYCMGGHIAIKLASLFPERFKVTGSFHGARLVSDAPDSPHTYVAQMKGRAYVAAGLEDLTDETEAVLKGAFKDAGVVATVERYPASHGFAVPDHPKFDAEAAERHYGALAELFKDLPR